MIAKATEGGVSSPVRFDPYSSRGRELVPSPSSLTSTHEEQVVRDIDLASVAFTASM